jgi:hypothetical protein
MIAVSSAIIVLAGAVIIGASTIASPRDPFNESTTAIGMILGLLGLIGWLLGVMRERTGESGETAK